MAFRLEGAGRSAGKRAKWANSSTSALRVATSRPISETLSSTVATTSSESAAGRVRSISRWMRSVESWMGVSGFLISCASRCATSRQAAAF